MRYGMVIDLKRCYGCYACVMACKVKNNTPPGVFWARVLKGEMGKFPNTVRQALPVLCFHCEEPPCVDACPSEGIVKQKDGLVNIDAELCSGCGECVDACPFGAIVMRPDGTSAKCDGCADEVALGWDPTCVRSCPTRALYFGPLAGSPFGSRMVDMTFEDHGIRPSVTYLFREGWKVV